MKTNAVLVTREDAAVGVRYQPIADPVCGPEEVIIRPAFVGICGSDLEQVRGGTPDTSDVTWPHILGHEWSGTVEKVGKCAARLRVGDRVIGHGDLGNNRWFGVTQDGAMAERFAVPESMCFSLAEDSDLLSAALIEPFACVLNAFRRVGRTDPSEIVHVFGCGAIGLSAVVQASVVGARVVAFDPSELRRQRALALGATLALDPHDAQIVSQTLRSSFGNTRSQLVVEASGVPAAQAMVLEHAEDGGTIILMGVSQPRPVAARLGLIQQRDLTVTSSTGAPATVWPAALRFIEQSKVDLRPMVSTILPFSRGAEAIDRAQDSSREIKIMLQPDSDYPGAN